MDSSFLRGLHAAVNMSPIGKGDTSTSRNGRESILDLSRDMDLSTYDLSDKAVSQRVSRFVNEASVQQSNQRATVNPAVKTFEQTVRDQPLQVTLTGHVSAASSTRIL